MPARTTPARAAAAALPLAVLLTLAACQSQSGRHETLTLQHVQEAKEQNEKGLTLFAAGKLDEAENAFREAVRLDPNLGPAHNNLGSVFLKQRNLYEAAWEFKTAAKLMPGLAEPMGNLGQVYETAGRLPEAQKAYEDAMALAPDDRVILGNLARVQIRRQIRTSELRHLLDDIALNDPRPEWRQWAQGEAVRFKEPEKDGR